MLVRCIGTLGRCGGATPGDFLFYGLYHKIDGAQHQIDCLACSGLVGNDASAMQIPGHGRIRDTFWVRI